MNCPGYRGLNAVTGALMRERAGGRETQGVVLMAAEMGAMHLHPVASRTGRGVIPSHACGGPGKLTQVWIPARVHPDLLQQGWRLALGGTWGSQVLVLAVPTGQVPLRSMHPGDACGLLSLPHPGAPQPLWLLPWPRCPLQTLHPAVQRTGLCLDRLQEPLPLSL